MPEATFGIIFSANAFGFIMSGQLNRLALRRFTTVQIVKFVNTLQLIFATLLIVYAFTFWGGLPMLIGLIFCYMSMLGFLYPNSGALAMAPFVRNAGAASALLGSLQFVISAVVAGLVSVLDNGTALPMTGAMAICSLLVFLLLRIPKNSNKEVKRAVEMAQENEAALC